MLTDRTRSLLRETAINAHDGIAPLSPEFLSEHDVTLDEAYSLAELIAVACELVIDLDTHPAGQRLVMNAMVQHAMKEARSDV